MKSTGSVLIVVLGLLAILAVIGITFITMSNLDRRTATNFAVQSQFILAADGAVDYVCHHLIQDLWAYNSMEQPEEQGIAVQRHSYYSTGYLLSDHGSPSAVGTTDNAGILRNEPFDHPSTAYDPWLCSNISSTGSIMDNRFSYGYQTASRYTDVTDGPYGLRDWGTDTDEQLRPNNLGFPASDGTVPRYTYDISSGPGHGVWIPDLSFPFDAGLIRVSVTVVDHGRMLNMNAHGNRNQGSERRGWYISDVDPSLLFSTGGGGASTGLPTSFFNPNGTIPGLWAQQNNPGNRRQLQVVIENPARYEDQPFTLDEEFELRRLTGTHFTSRLEHFIEERFQGQLQSAPGTATTTPAANRLDLTTVGWTAEVRPSYDRDGSSGQTLLPSFSEGYRWRKVDLNLDSPEDIRQIIEYLEFLNDDQDERQFVANICAFRDGKERDDDNGEDAPLLHKYANQWGASRQPVFKRLNVKFEEEKEEDTDDDGDVDKTIRTWTVKVNIVNPWSRLYVRAPKQGLPIQDVEISMQKGTNVTTLTDFGDVEAQGGGSWLLQGQYAKELTATVKQEFSKPASQLTEDERKLSHAISSISLRYNRSGANLTIDRIERDFMDQAGKGLSEGSEKTIERGILVDTGAGGDADVSVVYIFLDDSDGGTPAWFEGEGAAPGEAPAGAVPIRFPKSVKLETDDDVPVGGLPPEDTGQGGGGGDTDVGFRAFRRVGDLNQVLCQFPRPAGEDNDPFWPWVPRVAEAMNQEEEYIKFSWYASGGEDGGAGGGGGGGGGTTTDPRRVEAANLFTVGGPWLDRIDNDGDGFADATLPTAGGSGGGGGGQGSVTFVGRDIGNDFVAAEGELQTGDQGGRFGGAEIRVAGKINLNTASADVLEALGDTFGINNLSQSVMTLRATRPIESPADIVNEDRLAGGNAPTSIEVAEAKGPVERRDLAYTLLSNIATVRSDTYSIYGTVQYVDLQAMHDAGTNIDARKAAVRRSRRFWALVDRSPSASHHPMPGSAVGSFIRPRVLNFQWMD